jgi:hypothetical protein
MSEDARQLSKDARQMSEDARQVSDRCPKMPDRCPTDVQRCPTDVPYTLNLYLSNSVFTKNNAAIIMLISSDSRNVCSIRVGFISSARNFIFNTFLSTLTSPNKKI